MDEYWNEWKKVIEEGERLMENGVIKQLLADEDSKKVENENGGLDMALLDGVDVLQLCKELPEVLGYVEDEEKNDEMSNEPREVNDELNMIEEEKRDDNEERCVIDRTDKCRQYNVCLPCGPVHREIQKLLRLYSSSPDTTISAEAVSAIHEAGEEYVKSLLQSTKEHLEEICGRSVVTPEDVWDTQMRVLYSGYP